MNDEQLAYIKTTVEQLEKAIKESVLRLYLCDKEGNPILDVNKFLEMNREK